MYSSRSKFKILSIGVPALMLFLGLISDSGSLREPSVKRENSQKEMTKSEFDKLPDDHVFTVRGRRATKAQILARFNNMRSRSRRIGREIDPEELKAMSEIEHQEMVRKDNMKVMEHIKRQVQSERPQRMVEAQRPGITSVFCVPPISPGEDIFIKGYGFGNGGVGVRLYGSFMGFTSVLLNTIDSKPGYVHARVIDMEGVRDQPASLVVSVKGVESNHWPIEFQAKRRSLMLKPKDYIVLRCHPGYDATGHKCNVNATRNPDIQAYAAIHQGHTVDTGEDIVSAELKNGWHFRKLGLFQWKQGPINHPIEPNAQLAWVSDFRPVGNRLKLNIGWIYVGKGGIEYDIEVVIMGPAGIPYD
jgi:hypothetical protein